MISDLDVFLRLAASLVLGGVVGYERQAQHKSAGLRTCVFRSKTDIHFGLSRTLISFFLGQCFRGKPATCFVLSPDRFRLKPK